MTVSPVVKQVFLDQWEDQDCIEQQFDAPTAEVLRAAFDRLDGRRHTLLTLQGEGERHLAVGGGPDRFVVYMTEDNLCFYNLVTAVAADDQTESVVAGGQEGDYPSAQVITKSMAWEAVLTYFASGTRSDQTWSLQD